MTASTDFPLLFALTLHAHQPEGNFDSVFEAHVANVYEPFLATAVEEELLPLSIHLSGPLLDWLQRNAADYLDRIGDLASAGRIEVLLGGYYEPILPSLCREDRLTQIHWMQETVRRLFGVEARGLWLAERVWEPDLAADLAEAGVEYVLVDDRHFIASGLRREELHKPFRTESCGRSLGLFAIDEKLRYLIPFHEPEETARHLREIRRRGDRLAVAADDIEKLGGWPGTREWVYEKGWLRRFAQTVHAMREGGEITLATLSHALATVPSGGLVYLPSASYREMEEWALPAEAFQRLAEIREKLGGEDELDGESPLLRGSHWRNFLVKYSEANLMHKKMLALSTLCRERGDPQPARRAIGRAQCNDAYWHGVFGGLYLRHLRDAVWANLAEAEGILRAGEPFTTEPIDLDLDGHDELWVHSSMFSALVSPSRGGAVAELTLFSARRNLANTLTRRREPYHLLEDRAEQASLSPEENEEGSPAEEERETHGPTDQEGAHTPSIHEMEAALRLQRLPPIDHEDRMLFVDRVLSEELNLEQYRQGSYEAHHTWARDPLELVGAEAGPGRSEPGVSAEEMWIEVVLSGRNSGLLEKRIRFSEAGRVEVRYRWDPTAFPPDTVFTTELSLAAPAEVRAEPDTLIWRFPIRTVSKSERGFEEVDQGESVTIRWPVGIGEGRVRLTPTK